MLSGAGAEGVAKLQSGRYDVPFGVMVVAVDQTSLTFAERTMTSFVPTMNLEDRVSRTTTAATESARRCPPAWDDPRRQLTESTLTGRLALCTIYDSASIHINGHTVPLKYDQTAVRALFAVEGKGWTRELSGLLSNALAGPNGTNNDNLFGLEPHLHGRIPVVLVHGTASSPLRAWPCAAAFAGANSA